MLIARYKDQGGLLGQDLTRLRTTRFNAADADMFKGVARRNGTGTSAMNFNEDRAWICFKNVDLTGLKTLKASINSLKLIGELEVRIGSPTGPIIGQLPVLDTTTNEVTTVLNPQLGSHDVYLVYREKSGGINIWKRLELRWLKVDW